MVRIVSAVTAVVVFVWFLPVFGQESAPSVTSSSPGSSSPVVEGGQKGEQHDMEGDGGGKGKKGKGRGNGHGKKGGLDRAEEAAGEHGKHGRDRARGHGKHGDREKHRDKDNHDEGEKHERD